MNVHALSVSCSLTPVFQTKTQEAAVEFRFPRGRDQMEAVFTIHFPFSGSAGELHLKTYAERKV